MRVKPVLKRWRLSWDAMRVCETRYVTHEAFQDPQLSEDMAGSPPKRAVYTQTPCAKLIDRHIERTRHDGGTYDSFDYDGSSTCL